MNNHQEKTRVDLWSDDAKNLEREAVALVKQYRFFLPQAAKDFFRRLADFLNWQDLKKEL